MAKKKDLKTDRYTEIENSLSSWKLVQRNGWAIKISLAGADNVLLVFASRYTGQTWLSYCFSEDEAMEQINIITSKNAQQFIDTGIKF